MLNMLIKAGQIPADDTVSFYDTIEHTFILSQLGFL